MQDSIAPHGALLSAASPVLRSAFEPTFTGMCYFVRGAHSSRGFFLLLLVAAAGCCLLLLFGVVAAVAAASHVSVVPFETFYCAWTRLQVADGWWLLVFVNASRPY